MKNSRALQSGLAEWANSDPSRESVAATVMSVVQGCASIAGLISSGSVWRCRVAAPEAARRLEQQSSELMHEALQMAPVGMLVSGDSDAAVTIKPDGPLMVALQPLDTPLNIDKNVSLAARTWSR